MKSRAQTPQLPLGARVGVAMMFAVLVLHLFSSTAAAQGTLQRFWNDLVERPSGPMAFRFLLQPAMATFFAIRDGLKDARTGRSPYFWTIVHNPRERRERLHEGLAAVSRVLIFGLIMDTIYQLRVLKAFYPVEAIDVAILLAFVPYLLMRGPVARIARRKHGPPTSNLPAGSAQ